MHVVLLKRLSPLPYEELPPHLLVEIKGMTGLDKLLHTREPTIVRRSAWCGERYGPEKCKERSIHVTCGATGVGQGQTQDTVQERRGG